MRRRLQWAMAFYVVGVLSLTAGPQAVETWQRHRELTEPVYAPITDARVTRGADSLIWAGVSRKLADCAVIPGSPVTLSGHWKGPDGQVNPRAYPATRPSGELAGGSPLVVTGGAFVVGPWILRDTPEAIAAMVSVSSFVHCRFPSGIERFAEIGPVKVP